MDFNYEVIAQMAADLSKNMLKLNNQLDKIIDKQNELTDPEEQKEQAIELINSGQWDEAAKLCAEQSKEETKRTKLNDDEANIREELESLRTQLVDVSQGQIPDTPSSSGTESDD